MVTLNDILKEARSIGFTLNTEEDCEKLAQWLTLKDVYYDPNRADDENVFD